MRITEWNEDDRPREKLFNRGLEAMTDAELLAIIIRTGTRTTTAVELSMEILRDFKGNLTALSKLSPKDLMNKYNGVGMTKAVTILASLEFGKRRKDTVAEKGVIVTSSRTAYEFIYPKLADLQHEELWALYLDNSNKIIYQKMVSRGGVAQTVADVRVIIKDAIIHLATGIILCHNHPSGSLRPSESDNLITIRTV